MAGRSLGRSKTITVYRIGAGWIVAVVRRFRRIAVGYQRSEQYDQDAHTDEDQHGTDTIPVGGIILFRISVVHVVISFRHFGGRALH